MNLNKGLIKHLLFLTGYVTAFWGAFEMAYQASVVNGFHPIWSGTWGFPIPHHYVIGFIIVAISYPLFTKEDWIVRVLEKFK